MTRLPRSRISAVFGVVDDVGNDVCAACDISTFLWFTDRPPDGRPDELRGYQKRGASAKRFIIAGRGRASFPRLGPGVGLPPELVDLLADVRTAFRVELHLVQRGHCPQAL